MFNKQNIKLKQKLSKFLLVASFLLSVFSFSGFVVQNQTRAIALQQTEICVSKNTKANKLYISYKKALHTFYCKPNAIAFDVRTIFEFNNLSQVKFNALSKQVFEFHSGKHFQSKIIPKNLDEDPIPFQG